jgi:2-polyprenyl-3-methyl-5-hydroxy-6-metoxy-1,4-benzoquinol methylase
MDYIDYIDKCNDITNCEKKYLKYYHNNINTIYQDNKSNNQLNILIKDIYIKKLNNKIIKLKILLNKFFSYKFIKKFIKIIKNNNKTDKQYIKYIFKSLKKSKNILNYDDNKNKICNEWNYIIEHIILNYKKVIDKQFINFKYLDIGCGSGSKTIKFSNFLNLNIKNVYGSDIEQWGPYKQNKINHKFNFINIINNKIETTLKFDLITCILMLHHVQDLDFLIKQIYSLLNDNGILIIIEHNKLDDYDNMMLDILHMLYGYLYDKNISYLKNPDYGKYYNWFEWRYILENHNFIYIKTEMIFESLSNETRYDNIFFSIYKKKIII